MKKRIQVTAILSILVLVGLSSVVVGVSRFAVKTPNDTDVTKLQKTGDRVAESSSSSDVAKGDESAQKSSSDSGGAPAQPTPAARSAPEVSRSEFIPASPKQTEVRQSTAIERVYYPLVAPDDPGYTQSSWPLVNMNAPAAWDLATGASATVIAVLDTGFALDHDDLKDSWYQNSGETGVTQIGSACWSGVSVNKSTNNCDDDSNGYIDDWRGWNFYDGTNNPMAGQGNPSGVTVSHGTETAGLAGAKGNNGTGIATINWNTQLMPLQVLSDDGPGYTSDVAAAVYYAVDSGVDVINLSLGGNEPDSVLLAATDYAYDHDVVVVAAAGNCGVGTGSTCDSYPTGIIGYPARNPHVISVGAVTSAGERASFSSYGDALDVVAPGAGSIYSTTWSPQDGTSSYRTSLNGTSFSAPLVASLASLLKSVRTSAAVDEITALILGTAQKTGISDGIYSTTLGHGIVDAYEAVTVAQSFDEIIDSPVLYQTGNHVSEHRYSQDTSMASGCKTEAVSAHCALWFEQDVTGYDRILPYTVTSDTYTSWTWPSSILDGGSWQVRTIQAGEVSRTYGLSQK